MTCLAYFPFLNSLIHHNEKGSLTLNLSFLLFNDWNSFFEQLKDISPQKLCSLNFSGNVVDSKFFYFLHRAPNLTFLELSQAIDENPINLQCLRDFIQSHQKLETLKIRGNRLSQPSLIMILSVLKFAPQLKTIDFSDNSFGEDGFSYLIECLSSAKQIQHVIIQNCGVLNPSLFNNLFTLISTRQPPLKISYPDVEISQMLSDQLLSKSQVKTFKAIWENAQKENDVKVEVMNQDKSFTPYYIPSDKKSLPKTFDISPDFQPIVDEEDFRKRITGIHVPPIPTVSPEKIQNFVDNLKSTYDLSVLISALSEAVNQTSNSIASK